MFLKNLGLGLIFFILSLFSGLSYGVKVSFPDEELTTESVLPLVNPPRAVLNRNVPLKGRFEFGLGGGTRMDEVFYFPFYGTGLLAYHLTEAHSLNLTGYFFLNHALGANGHKLKYDGAPVSCVGECEDKGQITKLHSDQVPYPAFSMYANYQYAPFYGKISMTKAWVMNLSIYAYGGPGLVISSDNDYFFAGNLGLGQKLYFGRYVGLRADLGLTFYYGPNVARIPELKNDAKLRYNQLKNQGDKKLNFNFVSNLWLIFMI